MNFSWGWGSIGDEYMQASPDQPPLDQSLSINMAPSPEMEPFDAEHFLPSWLLSDDCLYSNMFDVGSLPTTVTSSLPTTPGDCSLQQSPVESCAEPSPQPLGAKTADAPPSIDSQKPRGSPRLMSISKASRSKKSRASPNEAGSGRVQHNQIEKKYRCRLNQQFENLFAALQEADVDKSRSLSKSKVLILARERIEALTLENEAMKQSILASWEAN